MAAWAVKNTSPTSRGNQSMIGMGAGAVSSLPGIGGLVYGLGGALGVISGGAQVIGGIAATFTGAGAAVGIPMILKGAVEVVVSVQVLSAAVEGEESKTGRETAEEEKEVETTTTNQGKEIDITPSKKHSTTTENPGIEGEPNSSVDILDENGQVRTRRWYDNEGHAYRDVDMTNHGNAAKHPEWPHEHFWDWSTDPPTRP